jgi:hypothetical protein
VVFTLQVGLDGVILSYLSLSHDQELAHLTSDCCLLTQGHHHHEDEMVVEVANCNISFSAFCSKRAVYTFNPAITFASGIWQPPKQS